MKLILISRFIDKITLSTFLLLFSLLSYSANEINYVIISGQVINMEYGNPVEGHTIYIISDSTQDGLNGYFNILTTNHEGYYYDTISTSENKGSLIIYTYDHYGKSVDTTVHFRFIYREYSVIIANFVIYLPYQAEQLQARFKYVQKSGGPKNKFSFFDQTNNNHIISWHWDFGDGSISTLQNPVHEYQSCGLFKITFTVTALVNNTPLTSTITKQLYISTREYYHIGGHAFSEYFPIDMGHAYLYLIDSLDNYIAIDTIAFDTLGYYYFYQVPEGDYLVKVEPMRESEYYGILLPTYYGDKLFWDKALTIHLTNTCWEYNINLAYSDGVLTGSGSISGNVEYVNQPRSPLDYSAVGVNMYLFDDSENVLTCHYTDVNGDFFFNLIELNTYWLYPEVTGVLAEEISVELTPETPSINNIEISIQSNSISYVIPGEEMNPGEIVGLPYPNPVSGTLNIPLQTNSGDRISVEIFDIYGHKVFSGQVDPMINYNNYPISTTCLINGTYILRAKINERAYDRVFVIAR
ncbi:MAG: T9SS type A sorting domain-containing protein [Bacteroidetes bacterium]|nr:T9SS type A sorting domain-containing protein [Bacteroidota bacterium]MBL6943367.1 T9SS type A sorting domain-containing protein [Bacteroidales bacterium]